MQTLKNNNTRLTAALEESTQHVAEWKKQLQKYKEESDSLKKKVPSKHICLSTIIAVCLLGGNKYSVHLLSSLLSLPPLPPFFRFRIWRQLATPS